ncbi:hypothetical protein [Anaerosalibacter sp. Marseille-P3206]|uniref:hypothetical protein n=1 Tax=Anaerosalibacter sp. Marseille-P3206 TaxID=1871005 RepID=UPI0009868C5F|nr:hypothetical protein [Anaerosalibacter sp. Marseille-P3206]
MNGSMGIGILSIISFVVSLAKEVAIIFLLIKIVQVLNIFVKNKEVPFIKSKRENIDVTNNDDKDE